MTAAVNLSAFLNSIETIMIQFSFSNRRMIPRWLREEKEETQKEKQARSSVKEGIQILEKKPDVFTSRIFYTLQNSGFFLIDGYAKELLKEDGVGKYYVARFIFGRKKPSEDGYIGLLARSFHTLSKEALWTVKAYLNPSGEEKKSFVSINMIGRNPLYENGARRKIWRKDEEGNRIGDEPVLMKQTGDLIFTRQGNLKIAAA